MIRAAICNNMIMPYTNRLFNYIADSKKVNLQVISCTLREGIRTWSGSYSKKYDHVILKGIELPLTGTRSFHINSGMWSTLNELKPDVVAINGIYPTMIIAAAWALTYRIPLTFLTDGWRQTMPHGVYHQTVRPFVISHCKSIICASEKGRQFFVEEGFDAECIFVAPIVPAWSAPAQLPDFDQRPYHLLWCGRLNDAAKNVRFFIDLAIAMQKRILGFQCRIVGDGPLRQELLDRLSHAGVTFNYTANINPDEMAQVFTEARMLALPSKVEPWGLVCNEAMQCGTPCAVSYHSGVADELVKDRESGFVLNLNLAQWVDTIEKAVTSRPVWTNLSEAALRVSAQFSAEYSGDRYIEGLLCAARSQASHHKGN